MQFCQNIRYCITGGQRIWYPSKNSPLVASLKNDSSLNTWLFFVSKQHWHIHIGTITGCPKNYTVLVGISDVNLAFIDSYSFSKCSSIVSLNIDTSFADICGLKADIWILKDQIHTHMQTRPLAFWLKQILEADRN